jgi:hypothetical protein
MPKLKEKQKAIQLRKKGYSYSEILKEIYVAKSTLSLWLREVGLSKKQEQRLTDKKLASMKRGWESCRRKKILITEKIKHNAEEEIVKLKIDRKELLLIGIALYWCEGHKERDRGSPVEFSNSDPYLIKLFIKWLRDICEVSKEDIIFRIFIHKNSRDRLKKVQHYWSDITGFSVEHFSKISWKKHNIKTKRKNVGENYFGVLRVIVKRSTNFNRKIQGWIMGICKSCEVV